MNLRIKNINENDVFTANDVEIDELFYIFHVDKLPAMILMLIESHVSFKTVFDNNVEQLSFRVSYEDIISIEW